MPIVAEELLAFGLRQAARQNQKSQLFINLASLQATIAPNCMTAKLPRTTASSRGSAAEGGE